MAIGTPWRDITPTLTAAQRWIESCLVGDKSLFSTESLWTTDLIADARQAFVNHLDAGKDDFLTKLVSQMSYASPKARALMAEILWALLLFPSNVKPETKRHQIRSIWALSELHPLDEEHELLRDDVLLGIGSGGPGFSTNRWRELTYLLDLSLSLKQRSAGDRAAIFSDYDGFLAWIDTVTQAGNRQYRHMLRYFAFPDRVERMSSNRDRRRILAHFGDVSWKDSAKWTDRMLDDALLARRKKLQLENPSETTLDFYHTPAATGWRDDEEDGEDEDEGGSAVPDPKGPSKVSEPNPLYAVRARNLILYGPPGTGKTFWLQERLRDYTDSAQTADRHTWLLKLLESYTWRPVIAAALADLGRPARVPEIRDHPLVQAKLEQRGRTSTNLQGTIWNFLQEHTPEDVANVKTASRREPFIFTKGDDGLWRLLGGWKTEDKEASSLTDALAAGPMGSPEGVQRYRLVTFHPSFTYEDFVRGIRPVYSEEEQRSEFRVVDGVFKRICDDARADPSRRYALFIDEINRANIAKVFGELITLIEPNKRAVYDSHGLLKGGMEVQLPGGDGGDVAERRFGVPANLDIYGTMNTADRSIALLDIALRRRFEFEEREPDYSTLETPVGNVDLGRFLQRVNDRLEFLLDRDHRIGHAYLMSATSLDELRRVMRVQIIPLLQEYFFDDFAKVAMVLETNATSAPFVGRTKVVHGDLFSAARADGFSAERSKYFLTSPSSWSEATFVGVYASESELKAMGLRANA